MPHSRHTHRATHNTRPYTGTPNDPIFAYNYNKKQLLMLFGCEPDEPNEPKSASAPIPTFAMHFGLFPHPFARLLHPLDE